jgi:acyl phosphate:glycerol-3-phosphate acyltransferase
VSPVLYAALWLLFAFLCGSIPFGAIVTRLKGVDIRSIGSGNTGATNVWRALGWKYGLSVLLLDALKGFVPVIGFQQHWFASFFTKHLNDAGAPWSVIVFINFAAYGSLFVGLAAILGHTFSPWQGFKGGKGVATGLGVVIALYQFWVLIPLAVFGITLAATRMVSLGSILAAITVALLGLIAHALAPLERTSIGIQRYWPFGLLVALLVIWTHRANIRRIVAGNENRVGRRRADVDPGPG